MNMFQTYIISTHIRDRHVKMSTHGKCVVLLLECNGQDDQREEYERDRARVIHSSAFRRLQAKTQILGVSGRRFSSNTFNTFDGSGTDWTWPGSEFC